MDKIRLLVSLPGDSNYLREQATVAKTTAARLGVDLQMLNANSDPITQSQQLLRVIQSSSELRPDGIIVEPVSDSGMSQVAGAAVAAGIAWVISNARVDYIQALRRTSKVPVFAISQNHVEIGRMLGRQFAALLPQGGSVLYLRGPSTNSLASQRAEGVESATPPSIQVKTLRADWTAEGAYKSVTSWLRLSSPRADHTHLIASQNTDYIPGAKKAFQDSTEGTEQAKWLSLPITAAGIPSQTKPLVDQGVLTAAVVTALTMDTAIETLVRAIRGGSQPSNQVFVPASFYPSLEELSHQPANK